MRKVTKVKAMSLALVLSLLPAQMLSTQMAQVYANDLPEEAITEVSLDESASQEESTSDETAEEIVTSESDQLASEEAVTAETVEEEPAAEEAQPTVEDDTSKELASAALPVITYATPDVEAVIGIVVNLHVEASGSDLTYQWQWTTTPNTESSWKDNTSSGCNNSTFAFTYKAAYSGRYYRCKVSSAAGTVKSKPTKLTTKTFGVYTQNYYNQVAEGARATFRVYAVGDDLTYQWQWTTTPNTESSWKNNTSSGYNKAAFSFMTKSVFDGRYYRCRVRNSAGEEDYSYPCYLELVPFKITSNPVNQNLDEGDKATFKVSANGSDMTYQWQWATSKNGPWTNNTGNGYNTATFSFTTKTAFSGRYYRCVVKNANGTTATSSPASLTVTRPAGPTITYQPSEIGVKEGTRVYYQVSATGKDLTYQWQWSTSANGKYTNNTSNGYNTSCLSFVTKGFFNGRYYRCVITDRYGRQVISQPAYTYIESSSAPVIIEQPFSNLCDPAQKAYYHVEAEGTGLTYQWQWATSEDGAYTNNTSAGCNTDTFIFKAKAAYHGRYYRCMIKDSNGYVLYTEPAFLKMTQY